MDYPMEYLAVVATLIILSLISLIIALKLGKKNRANTQALRDKSNRIDSPTEPFIEIHDSVTTTGNHPDKVNKNTLSEETIRRFRMRNRFYS